MARLPISVAALAALPLAACIGSNANAPSYPSPGEAIRTFGHLGSVPVPTDNPMTAAKIRLGQALFGDPALSSDGSRSCRSCHRPEEGFSFAKPLSPAFPTRFERRHAPTLINVAFKKPLLWDGRTPSLESQVLNTIVDPLHFNNTESLLTAQLSADVAYARAFEEAFGEEGITGEKIAKAIAAYERTLVFDDSPFDNYMDGDEDALTEAQRRGLGLFTGKANCSSCHTGPNLTDDLFHNLGVPDTIVRSQPGVLASVKFDALRMNFSGAQSVEGDIGRELVTAKAEDRGKFRTMSLRNVAQLAPYMHNGSLASLEDVVKFYNAGGGDDSNKMELLRPLGLSDNEMADIVAFLNSLTGRQR